MRREDLRSMVFAALFTALICVCSFIRINLVFTPVPVTMQFFAIFLAGAMLDVKWSVASVGVYIALGAVGLPVFSGMNGGLGVIAGPTGGFIFGFLAGVFVISVVLKVIRQRFRLNVFYYVLAMLAGMIVIYMFGTLQLMLIGHMGLDAALSAAVMPFVFADCVKLALAVVTVRYLEPAARVIFEGSRG